MAHSKAVQLRKKYLRGGEYVLPDGNIQSPSYYFSYSKSVFVGTCHQNITIEYSIAFDCIRLDLTQNDMYYLMVYDSVENLAVSMLNQYYSIFEEPFYKRSVLGISAEILAHYQVINHSFIPFLSKYKAIAESCDMENIYYNGPQNWMTFEFGG